MTNTLITQVTQNQLNTTETRNILQVGGGGGDGGSASGNTILNGITPPDNSLGSDGDFYIDTQEYDLYGPKAGGEWPAGVSLVGPPGSGIPASSGLIPLTATASWNGTPPSGTTNHSYIWQKVGQFVLSNMRLDYSVAGSLTSTLTLDLPSDMPPPLDLTNVSNGNILCTTMAIMSIDLAGSTMAARGFMRKDSNSPSGYRMTFIGNTSGNFRGAVITLQYAAAS